ncbi:MAG: hypothetical protein J6Q22_01315 [Prevotella sp.]|nr:hypothetical protein [Prevotella sp.]
MVTLVENFICQHFDKIYKEICCGTTGQAEWRKCRDNGGRLSYVNWTLHATKSSVLESIKQFLHLCLNANNVGEKYGKIPRWTKELLIAACMPSGSKYVDADRYSALVLASDPFTKFFFGCFDWWITDINPKGSNGDSYLEQYSSRIWYYKQCAINGTNYGQYQNAADLLSELLKKPRNQEAHTAKEEFFAEHPKCMQQLVYILYDYITTYYLITHVCKDMDGNNVCLLDEICLKTKMPTDFLSTHIIIECIDESSGDTLTGREADIRLYRLGEKSTKTAVNAIAGYPGKFEVTYFAEYIICIVSDGIESLPSEKFVIEYDFPDETIVKVNIPPKGLPKPEKVSIRELVFGVQDLSADVNWILDTVEQYADKCEYAEVARMLVMASVTKTEFSKKAYQVALEQLKESLKQEAKTELPNNFDDFLKAEMHKFQEHFSESFKPYRGKEDFFQLLECIDNLYNMFSNSGYDDNTPHIIQILNNADNIIKETKITNATTSSDESTRQQKRLQKLKYLFSMQDKYPEIVESESANIRELIENLYVNQINYYMDYSSPLIISIRELHDYIKSNVEHLSDGQKALKYAELLDRFLNDTPDNVIRIVQLISPSLLYWIDQCGSTDEQIIRLKLQCSDIIKELRDNRDLQVPMIPVSNDDKKKIEHAYLIIRHCIEELKDRLKLLGLPISDSEQLSEVRFDCLSQLVTSCSQKSLMQFVCCSLNVKSEMEWLLTCSSLGISCTELVDSTPYNDWERVNKILLHTCTRVFNILWKLFAGRERQRVGDTLYSTEVEVSNAEASLIVEYQQQQITKIFGEKIPPFFLDIMKVSNHVLPNHAKAMLLRDATVVRSCETESLVYVVSAVLRYWGYSGHQTRLFLDRYVLGKYAKTLVTQESLDKFFMMPRSSQRLYLEILMENKHHFACLLPCTRFMTAYRLIFSNKVDGNVIIDQREFFKKMSLMSIKDIRYFDYQEFVDLSNVVSLVAQFSNQHPEDEELSALSIAQTKNYLAICLEYLNKHLNIHPIEEGKMQSGLLHKVYLRKELKGKSPDEQAIIEYLDLFEGLGYHSNDSGKFKSEWCEKEEKLFNEIISILKEKTSEYQQNESCKLWRAIHLGYWGSRMPYDDIKAERLMALRPFYNQVEFDKEINNFYKECVYGSAQVTIGNSSVLDGLNTIRKLFAQYGNNVQAPFDGQPTAFIDILIAIYKMKEKLADNLRTI